VLSLHGGYRINPKLALTAGIDNLLDATYAEHISRAGVNIPDFEPTEQVNEPGRTYWIKATARF
jgi:iron complex outermembrane receptor protein